MFHILKPSEIPTAFRLLLGQLGGRARYFKSPENPKSIVQEITELYTYL